MTKHFPGSSVHKPGSSAHKKYSPEWWAALDGNDARGKECEKIVKALFEKWNSHTHFAYHKLPDAQSARGALSAQPADFMYRCGINAGFVEVKACGHEFRLAKAAVSQHATLRKWALAGDQSIVLVHHYMQGVWRAVRPADLEFEVPSWDLRFANTFGSAEEALRSTGYFAL